MAQGPERKQKVKSKKEKDRPRGYEEEVRSGRNKRITSVQPSRNQTSIAILGVFVPWW
jgi:hypothetical protein